MMPSLISHLQAMLPRARPATARLLVVNGHPNPRSERFCAALCGAYAEGAQANGFLTRRLDIGKRGLRFNEGEAASASPDELAQMLEGVWWADRLFIAYPMWFDGPPPALKFLFDAFAQRRASENSLLGFAEAPGEDREARIVVTTALPALLYRTRRPGSQACADPDATSLAGLRVAHRTYIGSVDWISPGERSRWLDRIYALGFHEQRKPRREKGVTARYVS